MRNYDNAYICSFPKGGTGTTYPNCGQHCGDASNVNCAASYCNAVRSGSSAYRVENQPGGTVTLPNATANASFQCSTPGNNGWCRGGANLVFTANEPVSGYVITAIETSAWGYVCQPNIASPTCTYAPGDGAGTATFWAESSYGDSSAQNTVSWKIDTVAPTASPTTSGTMGNNGWYTTTATVQANASDATSGVAVVERQVDGGAWQNGGSVTLGDGVHTVAFRVSDNAGNASTTAAQTVKVDTIAPAVNPSIPSPNGRNGWFVTVPQVDASGSDATSGVASVQCRVDGGSWQSPPVNVAGDGNHTVACQAQDNAGNVGAWSGTVKVDTTAPSASASVAGTAGNGGWYVSSATVTAHASDATSGVSVTEYQVDGGAWQSGGSVVVSDGMHTVAFRVTDEAGNVTTSQPVAVKVDTIAPALNVSVPVPGGQGGWYVSSPVSVGATGNDATSGLAALTCSVDGGAWQVPPVDVAGDGVHTVTCRAEDNAGNVTQQQTTVSIDATAPVVNPSIPSPNGRNGWFVAVPVSVDASGSDATSGVASTQCRVDSSAWQSPPVSVSADGAHTVGCQVVDNAGNTATWSDTVKVDTAPPASAFSAPAEGAKVWGVVTLQGMSADVTSGTAKVEVSTDNGATWKPATLAASTSQWTAFWDTRALPDGDYTLLARAQDAAGNQEHTAIVHVTVANAPPQVSLHPGRWYSWQTALAEIQPNPYIPLKSVTVTVLGSAGYVRKWEYGGERQVGIHWNTRWYSDSGVWARPGEYQVVVEAVDIYGHVGRAEGTVIVPLPASTATPTATATFTPTPTATPTPSPSPTATAKPVTLLTPTPQRGAVVVVEQPPAPPPSPGHAAVGWLAAAVVVLGSVLTLDPRPREIRALNKAIRRYLEVHHD